MSQEGVYKILKDNPDDWFSTAELAKRLGIGIQSCANNLRKMWYAVEVQRKTQHQTKIVFWRIKR